MGLYIKDLDLPSKEAIEPGLSIEFACGIDGKMYARLYHYRVGGLIDWKEAVSAPEHGDLIDREALVNNKYATFTIEEEGLWGAYRDKGVWLSAVENAPTIIPSDKNINIQKEFLQNWHEEGDE